MKDPSDSIAEDASYCSTDGPGPERVPQCLNDEAHAAIDGDLKAFTLHQCGIQGQSVS